MDQTAIRVFSIYGRLAPVFRSQQDCQQSGKDPGCPQNIEQTPRQTSAPIWPDHSARRRRSAKSHSHGTARSEPRSARPESRTYAWASHRTARSSWSWHITPPSISDFSISAAGICMDVAKNPKPFCCTFMKKLSTPLCKQFRIKQKRHPIGCLFLAERGGFEPPVEFKSTHDFQSCALDQLSHLSIANLCPTIHNYTGTFPKCQASIYNFPEKIRIFIFTSARGTREWKLPLFCLPPWQGLQWPHRSLHRRRHRLRSSLLPWWPHRQ